MDESEKRGERLRVMRMEASQAESFNAAATSASPASLSNPFVETSANVLVQGDSVSQPRFDFYSNPMAAFSGNRRSNTGNQTPGGYFTSPSSNNSHIARISSSPSGVSNCYVFKSQLQEYAQKVGFSTPVYETIKEGPSHEPFFRSTVIVNNVRYDSLPGFYNRKGAEQSAAEVALVELAKVGETSEKISHPVHETGLCKNLLQEYAQKMNHAIPVYECRRDETPGREALFYCTVDIGGIRYIGGAARTKKEAEIKAARTALLAIQSSPSELDEKPTSNSQLTVIPGKRKGAELNPNPEPAAKSVKAKKARFKAKRRKKPCGNKVNGTKGENMGTLQINMQDQVGSVNSTGGLTAILEANGNFQDGRPNFNDNGREISIVEGALVPLLDHTCQNGQLPASNFIQSHNGAPDIKVSSMSHVDDMTVLVKEEVNKLSSVEQEVRLVDNSTLVRGMLQV